MVSHNIFWKNKKNIRFPFQDPVSLERRQAARGRLLLPSAHAHGRPHAGQGGQGHSARSVSIFKYFLLEVDSIFNEGNVYTEQSILMFVAH